jgi:hypothetical protein
MVDVRSGQMPVSENASPAAAIRRKLRALTAVLMDPAATPPERDNAERLKVRLEKQLAEEATPERKTPEGTWTDMMYRLGRGVKEIGSPPRRKGGWTDDAFRLGRLFRKGFKK